MTVLAVTDVDVLDRRVLLRADLDVPHDGEGNVLDDWRIRASLPTIQYLSRSGAKVAILAHLGRPKGVRQQNLSLKPAVDRLGEILQRQVPLASDCIGPLAKATIDALAPGDVAVLENVRFHPGEETNSPDFAGQLAILGDLYVNDAFGASVRSHASTVGVARYFSDRAAGLQLMQELTRIENFTRAAARPYVLIIGGAKVASKLKPVPKLLSHIDVLLVGGLVAGAFVDAIRAGKESSFTADTLQLASIIVEEAAKFGVKIVLPSDAKVRNVRQNSAPYIQRLDRLPAGGWEVADIGPESRANFSAQIGKAKRVAWNGPMGVYELPEFSDGTGTVAVSIARAVRAGVPNLIGGGNTIDAVTRCKLDTLMENMSVGGGAMLSSLAGMTLPGVAALSRTR